MKLMAAVLILLVAASASAQTVTRFPVNVTASDCPQPGGSVSITGQGTLVTLSLPGGNNSYAVNRHGTATGSNGAKYVFNDSDTQIVTAPGTGFPFTVTKTEKFFLIGQGGAPNVIIVSIFHLTALSDVRVAAFFEKDPRTGPSSCLVF
jgi:hypothetical protein